MSDFEESDIELEPLESSDKEVFDNVSVSGDETDENNPRPKTNRGRKRTPLDWKLDKHCAN